VVGVALGVAVVTAIDLASASAGRAFELSLATVTGRATHRVAGGPEGLDESLFRRLVVDLGVAAAAPVVEGYAVVRPAAPAAARTLRLLGLDPFSEAPFRPLLAPRPAAAAGAPGGSATGVPLGSLLTEEGAVLLTDATARELRLRPGDRYAVEIGAHRRTARLAGIVRAERPGDETAAADLMLADIATAQELLGRIGRLDRIDLLLPAGARGERRAAEIRAALPPSAQLVPLDEAVRKSDDLARSFRLNLRALSLLALVCGLFLIYGTMTFSIVQRRTLIATLRALGASRGEVFRLVLLEAAGIGLLGTAAGLLGGTALGKVAIGLVTRTLNDLYFVTSVRAVSVAPASLLQAALLGIVATLLAALPPALEAARADPASALSRSTLEGSLRRRLPALAASGLGLLAFAGVVLLLPEGSLIPSLGATFLGIVGYALLVPGALYLLVSGLRRPLGRLAGPLGRLAAGGLAASLSRTAVSVAALTVAISVSSGVGTMIGSFRATVVRWLDRALQADLYVSVPSRSGGDLDPTIAERARALPGVVGMGSIRRVELPTPGGPVRLVAIGTDRAGLRSFELREGNPAQVWPAFQAGQGVIVSEPFAHRTGVHTGGRLALPTAHGMRELAVLGVYYDYASDRGVVMLSRAAYLEHWRDPALSAFSLRLAPGADAARVAADLRRSLGRGTLLSIQPTRALKRVSLKVFDRTFSVTRMLRGIALLVAFVGILSSLLALQLERTRELGVLRALGLTSFQLWGLITAQTALLGSIAGLLSLPLGVALAAVMTTTINRRSFGWTIPLEIDPGILLQAVLLSLVAALLAGLIPAYRMARTEPTEALRAE
jgi:putative ABC transport system permease protein